MSQQKQPNDALRESPAGIFTTTAWWPLYVVSALAVLFGLWGRLKGLGTAPLTSDEYYMVRSADNILRTGLPEYPCGGYYVRGLLLQYPMAWLRSLGIPAELAPRILSALGGLVTLPLAYLLGRLLAGRWLGILTVAWLAASLWEIEMARFGRMYAPFQPIFLCYLLAFLKFTRDRDAGSLLATYAITVVGVLTWEGGIFLAALNLLPLLLPGDAKRLPVSRAAHAASALLLLWMASRYLRFRFRYAGHTAMPRDFDYSTTAWPDAYFKAAELTLQDLLTSPATLLLFMIGCLGAVLAWRFVRGHARHPATFLCLTAALVAAIVHQFLLAACCVIVPIVMGWLTWRELFDRASRWYWISLLALLVAWLGALLVDADLTGHGGRASLIELGSLAYTLLEYPDILQRVLLEPLRAMPVLTVLGMLALTLAVMQAGSRDLPRAAPQRVLLICLLALIVCVSYVAPKNATRYVFFLYPLSLLLGLLAVERFLRGRGIAAARSVPITAVLAAVSFVVSEDFQPVHVARIDSRAAILRDGFSDHVKSHLIWRTPIDEIAELLDARVVRPGDVVVSGLPGLEYYYRQIDYAFMDVSEPRFIDWACVEGTVDRWTNRPLLSTSSELSRLVDGGLVVWLVLQDGNMARLVESTGWQPYIVFRGQRVTVARLTPHSIAQH